MYTKNYLDAVSKVEKLELIFKNNPCKNTAKPLSQSRVELEKLSYNNLKFTPEFRKARQQECVNSLVECLVDGNFRNRESRIYNSSMNLINNK